MGDADGGGAGSPWRRLASIVADLDHLYSERPDWVTGYISLQDARFLLSRALEAEADLFIEIGTASGISTAVLAQAVQSGSLVSYDTAQFFYADATKLVGDAARMMLPREKLERLYFRNPAGAFDLRTDYGPDTIPFLFIDANHKHPWPTLDLLAALPCLKAGSEVVMHDIDLPNLNPDFPTWGAKHLFDDLDLEKRRDEASDVPNIGSIVIPADKDALREQLVDIVHRHPWEVEVHPGLVEQLI